MSTSDAWSVEQMLAHAEWVRSLAARLVKGPHDAADVAQEVWRATLAAGPRAVRSPRAWLAGAVRNVARVRRRSQVRRERHEGQVQHATAAPSAADLVAEQELRGQLIALVDQLPAGEREVVLLRFWQGLPPRAVAKQLGIPVDTVRSRTARALERLREQLDRRHGDRRTWCLLLVPLLDARTLRAAGVGSTATGTKVGVAAAAAGALLVGGYALYAQLTAWSPIDLSSSAPASELLARFDAPRAAAPAVAAEERAGVDRSAAPAPGVRAQGLAGSVVDLAGQPIAGAFVHRDSDDWFRTWIAAGKITAADWSATTDANGVFVLSPRAFAFRTPKDEITIGEVTHPDYVAELQSTAWPLGAEPRIAMRRAFAVDLDVEVVERGTGAPVPRFGVFVEATWGEPTRVNGGGVYPDPRRRSLVSVPQDDLTQHGVDGRLQRTIRVVDGADNQLVVSVRGSAPIREPLPVPAKPGEAIRRRYEVEFDASAKAPGNTVVHGVVVDALTDAPIAGAYVSLDVVDARGSHDVQHSACTTTRADGGFALGFDPQVAPSRLRVQHPDHVWQGWSWPVAGWPAEPLRVRVLPLASLEFVVTEHGDPVPGVHVLLHHARSDQSDGHARATTDAAGRVRFERLPPQGVALYITPDVMAPDEQALDSVHVSLQPGERRVVDYEFHAPDRVDVRGSVFAERDVAGGVQLVPCFVPLDDDHGWIASHAASGSGYLAGGVRRGRYLVLLAPAVDDHRGPFAFAGVVTVGAPVMQVFDFELPRGAIVGRVAGDAATAGDDEPLRVVAVPCLPKRSLASDQLLGTARVAALLGVPIAADGTFRVPRIADGPAELQLRRGATVLARREVDVRGGLADVGVWEVGR